MKKVKKENKYFLELNYPIGYNCRKELYNLLNEYFYIREEEENYLHIVFDKHMLELKFKGNKIELLYFKKEDDLEFIEKLFNLIEKFEKEELKDNYINKKYIEEEFIEE